MHAQELYNSPRQNWTNASVLPLALYSINSCYSYTPDRLSIHLLSSRPCWADICILDLYDLYDCMTCSSCLRVGAVKSPWPTVRRAFFLWLGSGIHRTYWSIQIPQNTSQQQISIFMVYTSLHQSTSVQRAKYLRYHSGGNPGNQDQIWLVKILEMYRLLYIPWVVVTVNMVPRNSQTKLKYKYLLNWVLRGTIVNRTKYC